ncbi:uncharacterized protein CDV56_102895 [Aspergillus thermomutatus]|uniref:Uncharacterized protein n=1 Tax=Aspergillus thermomutatus TaxID=41047 RepID=A0A397FYG2_ASPTH|nr:uncharacterized protein CDV56_102895 [Aspergillus thermomutatus]RHZ43802.1 hypothetical protein CDV56_102895 [Aspergillus thermomutatus]
MFNSDKKVRSAYAIFRLSNPDIPPRDILEQCLEKLEACAVGFVPSLDFFQERRNEQVGDLVLEVFTENDSDEGITAATTEYIHHQIAHWEDDQAMLGWWQFDQYLRLKEYNHME